MGRSDHSGPNQHYRDCVEDMRLVIADALTAPSKINRGGWHSAVLCDASVEILRRDCGCRVLVLIGLVVSMLDSDGAKLADWLAYTDRLLERLPE